MEQASPRWLQTREAKRLCLPAASSSDQTCAGTQQVGEVVDHSQAVDLFGEVVDHPQAADQSAVLDTLDFWAKIEPTTPLRVGFAKRDWKLKEPLQRKPTSDHFRDKERSRRV